MKSLEFLKSLQKEMLTQETDIQAEPRFWVLRDKRMVRAFDDVDDFEVYLPNEAEAQSLDSLLEEIKEGIAGTDNTVDFEDYDLEQVKSDFEDVECEITAEEFVQKYIDKKAEVYGVRAENYIVPNTMFLTKQDAKEHIKLYGYNYTKDVHTYAMTALRSPSVEKLYKVIQETDWEALETTGVK